MALKIASLPQIKDFKLLKSDPTGETVVTLRQATAGDEIRIGNLFSEQTQIWDDEEVGRVQLKRKWNFQERKRFIAYLTLVGCNIEVEDERGEAAPLFRFKDGSKPGLAMSQADFFKAWDNLPQEVADEIYECILEMNPQWDFSRGED